MQVLQVLQGFSAHTALGGTPSSRIVGAALLALIGLLASCGGGGGGGASLPSAAAPSAQQTGGGASAPSAPNSPTAPVRSGELLITEVAGNSGDQLDSAWFEVYNPGSAAVNLSAFTLRSSAQDLATSQRLSASFTLPDQVVPPQGFVVLAGKSYPQLLDGPKIRYLANGSVVPGWAGSGFIELVRTSDQGVVDVLRFGDGALAGESLGWTGAPTPALAAADSARNQAMVRLAASRYADTNTAADWVMVNFSTPGGANDVAPGVTDVDGDGLPSSAKQPGGTYGGVDYYAMGARLGGRDVFVEINTMNANPNAAVDPTLVPRREALQKVVDAFAQRGIRMHIDIGNRYSPTFDPAAFNLGGGGTVPFARCTDFPSIGNSPQLRPGCSNFYTAKSNNFDVRRRNAFHFVLFASSQNADGSAGSTGIAEYFGNDVMITLGQLPINQYGTAAASNLLINLQATTLMHELGHNFGLGHGGSDEVNNKPNYLSIMNYLYQLDGLTDSPTTLAGNDRYRFFVSSLNNAGPSPCLLRNSVCSNTFLLDYSDGSGAPMSEAALNESALLGRGAASSADYGDWNSNRRLDTAPYAFDLNRDFVFQTLRDYNDWGNLSLPFARTTAGYNSGAVFDAARLPTRPKVRAMNDFGRQRIIEGPLSPAWLLRARIDSGAR